VIDARAGRVPVGSQAAPHDVAGLPQQPDARTTTRLCAFVAGGFGGGVRSGDGQAVGVAGSDQRGGIRAGRVAALGDAFQGAGGEVIEVRADVADAAGGEDGGEQSAP